jgi:thermitase
VIVKFDDAASEEAREAAAKAQGGRILDTIPQIGAALVELPSQATGDRTAAEKTDGLAAQPAIVRAEPNTATAADWTPNDAYYASKQWNLRKVGAPTAWNTARGADVRIAILDTGIQNGHPDISGKVVLEKDVVDGDNVAQAVHPHGTHVAGIAAARTNNSRGIAGACPSCAIIDVRISDSRGASTAWRIAKVHSEGPHLRRRQPRAGREH